MAIQLIAGLGNPGPDYAQTRHNAGFWFVDRIATAGGLHWQHESRFYAETARMPAGPWLAKPLSFMNRSGQSVGALARFFRIPVQEILVVHDELDLLPGDVRLKQGGGHGGHNGVRDIATSLGSPDFWRLRIGIGHPRSLGLNQQVADFVLHRPRVDDEIALGHALSLCLQSLPDLVKGEMAAVQRRLHVSPDKPA